MTEKLNDVHPKPAPDGEERHKEDQNLDRPHHFAGGWQGLDLVGADDEQSGKSEIAQSSEDSKHHEGYVGRTIARFPRTYNIFFKIVIPCFILIFLTFIFGAGLANLEWDGEKQRNDETMSRFADLVYVVDQLSQNVLSAPEQCLNSYEFGETFNKTALEVHMKECGERLVAEEDQATRSLIVSYFVNQEYDSLSFDWMKCTNETSKFTRATDQADHIIDDWKTSYLSLKEKYKDLPDEKAHNRARAEATGSQDCKMNPSAGALFWFTVMTTIGYGNTAPVTTGGRLMVYTLGFCSILLFTALIGQAGHICVTIVDDFFLRCRAKRLTEGILSTLFWLLSLLLWMFAIAGLFIGWADNRANQNFPIKDAYWFTFITTTTVGLGDIYIPPDIFRASDMFYIPFFFLLAFVLLATFLLKFSITLTSWFPSKGISLSAVLKKTRNDGEVKKEIDGLNPEDQAGPKSEQSDAIDTLKDDQANITGIPDVEVN